MHATEQLRESFIEAMRSRGVPVVDAMLYRTVLREVHDFLGHCDPRSWRVADLERFLATRKNSLDAGRVQKYGMAMGLLTEALDKLEPMAEVAGGFDRVETSNSAHPFADTQFHLEADVPNKTPAAPMSNDDDDFLAENQAQWTARKGGGSWGRTPTANRQAPKIEILFDRADECVAIAWSGFVVGTELRASIQRGLDLQRTHGSGRWLIDMRRARVMSQEDNDWFADWLHNAGPAGVRRFAIVLPEHVITKMQLMRLRDATEASTATFATRHRVQIAFFDTVPEAREWLRKEGF